MSNSPTIPKIKKQEIWNKYIGEKFKSKCLCCNLNDITPFDFECGHILAKSKGGELTHENLRPICRKCNQSMGNENMIDFMKKLKYDISKLGYKIDDEITINCIMRNNYYGKTENVFDIIIENNKLICPWGHNKKSNDLFNSGEFRDEKFSQIFINKLKLNDYILLFDRQYNYSLIIQILGEPKTQKFDNIIIIRNNNCIHKPTEDHTCKKCDESIIKVFPKSISNKFVEYMNENYIFENMYAIFRDVKIIGKIENTGDNIKKYKAYQSSIGIIDDILLNKKNITQHNNNDIDIDNKEWTEEDLKIVCSVCQNFKNNDDCERILQKQFTNRSQFSIKMIVNRYNTLSENKSGWGTNVPQKFKKIWEEKDWCRDFKNKEQRQSLSNYWYIKISANDDNFDENEKYCLKNKSVGIGFSIKNKKLVTGEKELKSQCIEILGKNDYKNSFRNYDIFVNKMMKNDIVFLCKGKKEILYIAQIDGDYYYDDTKKDLPHRRKIKNIRNFNTTATKEMIGTLFEVSKDSYDYTMEVNNNSENNFDNDSSNDFDNDSKDELKKKRDLRELLINNETIRHSNKNGDTWEGIYNKHKNIISKGENEYPSLSAFSAEHYRKTRPERTSQSNGWVECEVNRNNKWISIDKL
jgi:hypothetical protein